MKERLCELIAEWRQAAQARRDSRRDGYPEDKISLGMWQTYDRCADEIEAILEARPSAANRQVSGIGCQPEAAQVGEGRCCDTCAMDTHTRCGTPGCICPCMFEA